MRRKEGGRGEGQDALSSERGGMPGVGDVTKGEPHLNTSSCLRLLTYTLRSGVSLGGKTL